MTTVTVVGQELNVVDRGAGAPVLFLHAFPFTAAMWEYQYAALEDTHRVIGIDLPGFGASPAPLDPKAASMDGWADLVLGVIGQMELDAPTVVAASMGGYLTFALLRKRPEALGDLVLVATRPKSDDVDTWQRRTDQQEALLGGEDVATLAKAMVENLLSQATLDNPELVEYVLALMQHNVPEGWIAALEAMKNRPDAMSVLKGLDHRTLVVAGELDRVTPLSESTLISRLVSEGELVTIPRLEPPPEPREPAAVQRGPRRVREPAGGGALRRPDRRRPALGGPDLRGPGLRRLDLRRPDAWDRDRTWVLRPGSIRPRQVIRCATRGSGPAALRWTSHGLRSSPRPARRRSWSRAACRARRPTGRSC